MHIIKTVDLDIDDKYYDFIDIIYVFQQRSLIEIHESFIRSFASCMYHSIILYNVHADVTVKLFKISKFSRSEYADDGICVRKHNNNNSYLLQVRTYRCSG